jgi:hypothetical protein
MSGPTDDRADSHRALRKRSEYCVEQILKHGGRKRYFEKMESELTSMREAVNAMLKGLSERYAIRDEDESQ